MGASRLWWKRFVENVSLSLEWKSECVMEGEIDEQVGGGQYVSARSAVTKLTENTRVLDRH